MSPHHPSSHRGVTAAPLEATSQEELTSCKTELEQLCRLTNRWKLAGNIEKRLTAIEERLARLEVAVRDTPKTGFPQFSQLPPEIRLCIWEMAMPRRKFVLELDGPSNEVEHRRFNRFTQGLNPPVMSQVCHESRLVARRTGGMFLLYWDWSHLGPASVSRYYPYWTWFDGVHDVLQLHGKVRDRFQNTVAGFWDIVYKAQSIILDVGMVHHQCISDILDQESCRKTLRSIYIRPTDAEIAHRLGWSPEAIVELMGTDSFFLLDLQNSNEMKRVRNILSLNPAWQEDAFETWVQEWNEAGREASPKMAKAITRLKEAWILKHRVDGAEDHWKDDLINEDIPWVRNSLAKMPKIRPVYEFEKDDGRPVTLVGTEIPAFPQHEP